MLPSLIFFFFLIKKSENLPAHSKVHFFCTACWLSSDFSLSFLSFLWSPVSQWEKINSIVFSFFNQVRNIIDFFSSFCHLFGACAQKHSLLSFANVMSLLILFFFMVSFWFSLCLQCLSAVLGKGIAAVIPTKLVIWRGQKNKPVKRGDYKKLMMMLLLPKQVWHSSSNQRLM